MVYMLSILCCYYEIQRKVLYGPGQIAQLRALTPLLVDQNSVVSTYVVAHNFL